MTRIVSIVGARPQFIKAALISKKLRQNGCQEILVHTGQHYDYNLSGIFFEELSLPQPNHNLNVGSGPHGEQTGRMLIEIEKVLLKDRPHVVLVYGDTNTTLAGALAAAKLNIPLAHIESGLRSYNRHMPEEINRLMADHVSSLLLCPTLVATKNLQKEGFSNIVNEGNLIDESCTLSPISYGQPLTVNVGDVMFDIAVEVRNRVSEHEVLLKHKLQPKNYILATIHRAENTDQQEALEGIWDALAEIAQREITIFFPIHPRTRNALTRFKILTNGVPDHLRISEPVSYTDMIALESNAKLIITDSGGVQKEGYFFRTPCVIPRSESEWVELVEAGWATLAGAHKERIVASALRALTSDSSRKWEPYYGDGKASDRICRIILRYLSAGNLLNS